MAYSEEQKQEALQLMDAGIPVQEVADEIGCNRGTLRNWRNEREKEEKDVKKSIKNIRKQIEKLSRREPTEAVSRKIAMLSKSLATLERVQAKTDRAAKRQKPVIDISGSKEALDLKRRILETGGLYGYQREFIECEDQFRLVVKARQIGFSYSAAADALIGAVAGRDQLFLSASEEQALILIRYAKQWAKRYGIEFVKDTEKELHLANGAIIKALAHNFRTVQGFTGDIWMDEFAWYANPKKIWHAFVPSIGAIKGRLTIMSTPFEERSLFHDLIVDEERYFMFTRFRIDIYRAIKDGLDFDLETMRALFDADTWASAYECQFVDDESSLLSIELIKSCVDPGLSYYTPKSQNTLFSGYDVGRTKDRSTLAGVVLAGQIYEAAMMDVLAKAKYDDQKAHLKQFMRTYPLAQLAIDKTGLGNNLAENMYDAFKSRVRGVWFTNSSKEAMALNLKKHFEDKTIRIPNDPLLIADLHAIKRLVGAKSFKYDSKRNEHGHADRFWALALALSFVEVVVRKKGGGAWIM